jgi:transposase
MYLQMEEKLEVQMLRKEDYLMINILHKRGVYQKDIAEELGVHPKTVSRALKRGGTPNRKHKPRSSKLDPYKSRVDQLLSEGVWNAAVILLEIQSQGYTGGTTILRDYIAPKRPLRHQRQTVRFETKPGQQLQSDWGELRTIIGGVETKVYFIVNQLGFSRRFHLWCTNSLDAEHTYEGLVRSLEYFGGVPEEVLVDNQKSTVLAHPPGGVHFNQRFMDLAAHYGFTPRACKPYRARTKGKTERMIGYVKGNFFQRYRQFESWAHLNQLAEKWLLEEADQREHSRFHQTIADRFEQERSTLQPLPDTPYDTSYYETRRVGWDGYIDVRGNRYSAPGELAGKQVSVRIGLDDTFRVYHKEMLVAAHRLRSVREGWVTVAAHHRKLWRNTLQVERRPLQAYEEVS